ncbi:hypothetical protein FRB90_009754 [Tulasnella sp. 427]|nr:hypothetical protein FRB90_009754 [Tulasnella sp. 427]
MDFIHDEQLYLKVVERTMVTAWCTVAGITVLVWDWSEFNAMLNYWRKETDELPALSNASGG